MATPAMRGHGQKARPAPSLLSTLPPRPALLPGPVPPVRPPRPLLPALLLPALLLPALPIPLAQRLAQPLTLARRGRGSRKVV
jgi:hypothetical protein